MSFFLLECFFDKFFNILDYTDCDDGLVPKVCTDQKRLVIKIAYDSDTFVSEHRCDIGFKFRAKLGILDIVDESDKSFIVLYSKSASFCA